MHVDRCDVIRDRRVAWRCDDGQCLLEILSGIVGVFGWWLCVALLRRSGFGALAAVPIGLPVAIVCVVFFLLAMATFEETAIRKNSNVVSLVLTSLLIAGLLGLYAYVGPVEAGATWRNLWRAALSTCLVVGIFSAGMVMLGWMAQQVPDRWVERMNEEAEHDRESPQTTLFMGGVVSMVFVPFVLTGLAMTEVFQRSVRDYLIQVAWTAAACWAVFVCIAVVAYFFERRRGARDDET